RRGLQQVLADRGRVVVGAAVERRVGRRLPGQVAEAHVVRHHEEAVDRGGQLCDVHETPVPARRYRVGIDGDYRAGNRRVHLAAQVGDEGAELSLQVGICAARGAL